MKSRYRPPRPSFELCERMAWGLGLAVYRLPHTRSRTRRRYAVGRADQGAQADFITYAGIDALYQALKGKP